MQTKNNIETEIKLILKGVDIEKLTEKIESAFLLKRSKPFHQVTHQFFESDFTQQIAFPRIRNEQDGSITLTVKAKIKEEKESVYFKRLELETGISDSENVIKMMPFFGYSNKISWEKRRVNFMKDGEGSVVNDFEISLDEDRIEEMIKILNLEKLERSNKSYLGLWEDYSKNEIKDMLF
jgi:adenylate cyclase class IV